MKVWITRYALTYGIEEAEVETTHVESMVSTIGRSLVCFHKPYWHTTREDAAKHAEQLRTAKIASLEKSIKKMRGLSFATPPADAPKEVV